MESECANNRNKIISGQHQSNMRKQVILIMEGHQYPFGQAGDSIGGKSRPDARILVRKKHETRSLQERNQLLDKIHILKTNPNEYLMKIETVLEQENSIHVLYEYVPNSLLKNVKNLSEHNLHAVRDHLLDLAVSLAEIGFNVQWDLKNVGVNDKMEAKYYLDLDRAVLQQGHSRSKLQREHFKAIMELFGQFNQGREEQKFTSNKKKEINAEMGNLLIARPANSVDSNNNNPKNIKFTVPSAPSQQKTSPTKSEQPKLKQLLKKKEPEKPMRKSRTNWKQMDHNEQFMQDFMNVLDDKSENAQSKYVSDEEVDEQGLEQGHKGSQQGNEEEEIVWMSAPDDRHEEQAEPKQGEEEEEEVVWVDYRDFSDIRERAEAAIKRSAHVLQVFRSIIFKHK